MKNNKSYKVVRLISLCFIIYFSISIFAFVLGFKWEVFQRINLISDIFDIERETKNYLATTTDKGEIKKAVVSENEGKQDFELYKKAEMITNFQTKSDVSALPLFVEKLRTLKETGRGKVRVAYFGDSMIEGDLMSQTFRQLLQKEFGGAGVGFLPINSNVAKFRQTAYTSASGWKDEHFMIKGASNMYISGHVFTGKGMGSYKDNTLKTPVNIEKSILFGRVREAQMEIDGRAVVLSGEWLVNREVVSNSIENNIKIKSHSENLPLYGVSFESEDGVIVDNFSFRGITGVELRRINEDLLNAIEKVNHYDLVIIQYGVNLLFRPKDKDYSYYEKSMAPVLEKMKKLFPNTDFLLVSTADRAFRYGGEYKSAIGIHHLVETQARLAFHSKIAFYNQFETMGGENSIVRWANQTPPLANKDYIHPNHRGAEMLAEKLFNAVMSDYRKSQPKNTSTK